MMALACATLLNKFLGQDGLIDTVTLAYDELGPIVALYLGGAVPRWRCEILLIDNLSRL